jgi:hypothetical protein
MKTSWIQNAVGSLLIIAAAMPGVSHARVKKMTRSKSIPSLSSSTSVDPVPETSTKENPTGAYFLLKKKGEEIENAHQVDGWAYIISGSVSLGISIPAYYATKDVFGRAIYSLGQTIGVASIGYGNYLVSIKNDHHRFAELLASTNLTAAQRDALSEKFLVDAAERARSVRKIRFITHGLTAGLNFLNAFTSKDRDLKTALFFVGGINILAAGNFLFRESEEEEFLKKTKTAHGPEVVVGNGIGLRFYF